MIRERSAWFLQRKQSQRVTPLFDPAIFSIKGNARKFRGKSADSLRSVG